MGLFLCHCCNEHITLDPPHECKKEDIINYVDELRERAKKAERELDDVKESVFKVISQIPSIDEEIITLKTDFIRELWTAAKLQWYEVKTPEAYIYRWHAMLNLLRCAYDLFRDRDYHDKPNDFLSKLKDLHKSCEYSKEVLGYQSSKFKYKPEDLV